MSTLSATTPHRIPATRLATPLTAALHRIAAHLREQRARHALEAELSRLSDRDLADIGLSRPARYGTAFDLPSALHR